MIKRAFDMTASTVLLLLLAAPATVVALAVLLVEGSPVFYGQQRMGRHGRPFTIFKFRTMRPAAAVDAEQCYRDEILPEKLALQMDYVRTRSLSKDIAVLFRTLGALMG